MAEIPEFMRAIDPPEAGGPELLAPVERAVPQPRAGEVLIKIAAAGINRPDVLQRRGLYPPLEGAPSTLGLEAAGRVVALGDGAGQEWLGRRVAALLPGGGYAEYAAARIDHCLEVPDALSLAEAAAMPETLFTVWHNLFERGAAAKGDVVLVHGGTSGIGTMAIALCRLFGIAILVTCGSGEKCRAAVKLGAALAIDYGREDFVERVQAFTDDAGVAIVLDMVGGDYLPRNLQCLAEEGRHVSIAFQRGREAELDIMRLMRRRLTLTGSTLRARSDAFKAVLAAEIRKKVWPFAVAGRLRPVIDSAFPLEQAADAHRRMEEGDHVGKIVLEIAP
ncbi:MAG: NAD(P)H-quinone oxidoreductase [Sphingomonadaceae bacterium]